MTRRFCRIVLAVAAASALATAASVAANDATDPPHSRQRELMHMLKQDCGACHGMRLTGGLGPPLTPQALKDKPAASLVATVVSRPCRHRHAPLAALPFGG